MSGVRLIVNADDFGQSAPINQGIITAHECGVVTSASLMVRWTAAAEAAAYAKAKPSLSVGLHLDLGEWAYRDDAWIALYEAVPLQNPAAVAAEIDRQLRAFERLVGRPPTHLDSHQHVHRENPARAVLVARGRSLGIPVRHYTPTVRYCGAFYGQTGKGAPLPEAISLNTLLKLVQELPTGVTELGCHPGREGGDLDSMYRTERADELAVLCDARLRRALQERAITLCSFADLQGVPRQAG